MLASCLPLMRKYKFKNCRNQLRSQITDLKAVIMIKFTIEQLTEVSNLLLVLSGTVPFLIHAIVGNSTKALVNVILRAIVMYTVVIRRPHY